MTEGVWLVTALVAMIVAPPTARKLGVVLAARQGIKALDETLAEVSAALIATAGDQAS
jgi:hypothetical protein